MLHRNQLPLCRDLNILQNSPKNSSLYMSFQHIPLTYVFQNPHYKLFEKSHMNNFATSITWLRMMTHYPLHLTRVRKTRGTAFQSNLLARRKTATGNNSAIPRSHFEPKSQFVWTNDLHRLHTWLHFELSELFKVKVASHW